jgi:hypothetical protein
MHGFHRSRSPSRVRFQFGNVYQRREPGWKLLSRLYELSTALWLTPVEEDAHVGVESALYEGFVRGGNAAGFAVSIDAPRVDVRIHCHAGDSDWGPFSIASGATFLLDRVTIERGKTEVFEFTIEVKDKCLELEFLPDRGAQFLVNGIEILTPEDTPPVSLFATAPMLPAPGDRVTREKPRDMLCAVCDWLLLHRESPEFPGDNYTTNSGSKVPVWYTITFPIRAFLAGYRLLGDDRYLNAATISLDTFVSEQMPNGAWADHYRNTPTTSLDDEELDKAMRSLRQPMSDIGSVAACLALAAPLVDGPRQKTYLDSLLRFCRDWAAGFQRDDGSFNDGFDGHTADGATYSCATAIEDGVFALAGTLSGDRELSQRSEQAMRFLLPDWFEDGSMIGRAPHWRVRNREPFVLEPLYFGDQYYYDEGFITVLHHTHDDSLQAELSKALAHRVRGTSGLLTSLGSSDWWPIQDNWNNAKSIGMVATLLEVNRNIAPGSDLDVTLERLGGFLTTRETAAVLGVMPDDTERPARIYGMQTWSGGAREATGFAGMILGELLSPGSLYGLK